MADDQAWDRLRDLRAELEATFRVELGERLSRMEEAVRRLEWTASGGSHEGAQRLALLGELGREAHSISGGAQLIGQVDIGQLARSLEAHVDRAQADGFTPRLVEISAAISALARCPGPDRPNREEIARLVAGLATD